MKRKLLVSIFAVVMALSLSSCGDLSFEVDKAAMCNAPQYNQVAV